MKVSFCMRALRAASSCKWRASRFPLKWEARHDRHEQPPRHPPRRSLCGGRAPACFAPTPLARRSHATAPAPLHHMMACAARRAARWPRIVGSLPGLPATERRISPRSCQYPMELSRAPLAVHPHDGLRRADLRRHPRRVACAPHPPLSAPQKRHRGRCPTRPDLYK